MLTRSRRGDLDPGPGYNLMGAARITIDDKLVLGLLIVAVGTHVFTSEATKLGWTPYAVTAGLYFAGRLAQAW